MATATQKQLDYAADLIALYSNQQIAMTTTVEANAAVNAMLISRLQAMLKTASADEISEMIDALKTRNIKRMLLVAGIGRNELQECLSAAGIS